MPAMGQTQAHECQLCCTLLRWLGLIPVFADLGFNFDGEGSTEPDPSASGGGRSEFFARPSYQDGVRAVTGAQRGVPDIAMSAACDGSVNIYSSYQPGGSAGR